MSEPHPCPQCGQICYGRVCIDCHAQRISPRGKPLVCVCQYPTWVSLSPFPGFQCGRCKRVIS